MKSDIHTNTTNNPYEYHCTCIQCGYDLRATSIEGNCPECGAPCRWSLWLGSDEALWWRWLVMWGAFMLVASVIAMLMVDLIWIPFVLYLIQNNMVPPLWVNWSIEIMFPYTLLAIGAILATVSCSVTHTSKSIISSRQIARWCLLCGSVGKIILPFVVLKMNNLSYKFSYNTSNFKSNCLQWMSTTYPVFIDVLYAVGVVAVLCYLGGLLDWFASHKLSRHVWNFTRVVIICIITNSIWWAAHNVLLPGLGRPVVDPTNLSFAYWSVNFIIGWGTLAVLLWSMYVLWKTSLVIGRGISLKPPGLPPKN